MTMFADKLESQLKGWIISIAIVLCLTANTALIGFVWFKRKNAASSAIASRASGQGGSANWSSATFSDATVNGVHQTAQNSWSVKGGRAFMHVHRKADQTFEHRFVYPFTDFLSSETIDLVRLRWNVSKIEAIAEELTISPEQVAALKVVSPVTDILISTSERQRLRELFSKYLFAKNKTEAEKELSEAMVALDEAYYDPTMQRINEIAETVHGIFNQEQLDDLNARFGSLRGRGKKTLEVKRVNVTNHVCRRV